VLRLINAFLQAEIMTEHGWAALGRSELRPLAGAKK
jgi:hypothetical protein